MPAIANRKTTDYLVVHCSASQPDIKTDAAVIDRWHRQRGFLCIGYHFVIKIDGTVEKGRDENAIGAHVEGFNSCSIGICMVGGVDAAGKSVNNFSPAQFAALQTLLQRLHAEHPQAVIQGHRDFPNVAKDCPCFDVKPWAAQHNLTN